MTNDKQRERLATNKTKIFVRENITLMSVTKDELRKHYNEIFDRLQEYEVAEETGRIIVPPCKVGDKVYFVYEGDVLSDEIMLIEVTESAMYLSTCSERYMLINGYLYSEMLDEKAYFTKEEAEKALKGGVQG